jgi:UDP-galactopyranose mutase
MVASPNRQIRAVADRIYEKIFLHYTTKQWGLAPSELDPSVSARVPVHLSRDDRYFQDAFQKMPTHGYTRLFERMLDDPLIDIRLGTEFSEIATTEAFDQVIFTGPIDEFFDHMHRPLPYRSLRFELTTVPGDALAQECGVYNYPTPATVHPFTRVTEFRHLTGQTDVGATTLATEFPQAYEPGANEPYYPIPRDENRQIFRRYQAEADGLRTVLFAGRLADYSYYNMDQAVGHALAVFEKQLLPAARTGGSP